MTPFRYQSCGFGTNIHSFCLHTRFSIENGTVTFALLKATRQGFTDVVVLLLKHGANINQVVLTLLISC
jgi:hypothetical protein